jgi:hypothetical protein
MPKALINLNGIGMTFANRNQLINDMVAIGSCAVVQDDVWMAQEIRTRLGNQSTVMYRRYLDLNGDGDGDEDELYLRMPPDEWLNLVQEGASNGVYGQFHNEPVINQNNAPEFVRKNVELLQKAHARNIPIGFGTFAVGNPHESLIHSGAFDEMLLAANEIDALVLHEYFWKHPLDPSEKGFLCFRIEDWLERIQKLRAQGKNVKFNKFIIAEYGRDSGGGSSDGWRGQGWSAEYYLSLLLAGMEEYQRLAVKYNVDIYVNIFCAGSGFFNHWQSFNVEGEKAIYDGLRMWNKEHEMAAWDGHNWGTRVPDVTAKLIAGKIINIRELPSAGSADRGDLVDGTQVIAYYTNPFSDGQFKWYKIELPDAVRFVAELHNLTFVKNNNSEIPAGKTLIDIVDLNRLLEISSEMEALERERLQIIGRYLPG